MATITVRGTGTAYATPDVTTSDVSIVEHCEHDKDWRWQHRGYRASNRDVEFGLEQG